MLDVDGATTLNTTLDVTGLATLVSMTTGAATITGGTVDGTPLGGTTPATGDFTTISTTAAATLDSAIVSNTLDVTGEADFDASLCIAGNLDIGLDASFNGMLDVGGDAYFYNDVDVLGTLTVVDGSFTALYVDELTVSGSTITVGTGVGSATISEGSTVGNIKFNNHLELDSGKTIKIDGSDLSVSHLSGVSGTTTADDLNALDGFAAATSNSTVKAYVDSVATGLDVHGSVKAATTGEITASASTSTTLTIADGVSGFSDIGNSFTQDGISLLEDDRILIKDSVDVSSGGADAKYNGIYTVGALDQSNLTLTRATDMDEDAEVSGGAFTFVEEGTTNADTGWVLSSDGTLTIGTSSLTFTQFSSAGIITGGTGLTKTGNDLDVDAAQTQITSVGTLTGLTVGGTLGVTGILTAMVVLLQMMMW